MTNIRERKTTIRTDQLLVSERRTSDEKHRPRTSKEPNQHWNSLNGLIFPLLSDVSSC